MAGHPGQVDAIGVIAGPGFDASRLKAAAGGAAVLSGRYQACEQAVVAMLTDIIRNRLRLNRNRSAFVNQKADRPTHCQRKVEMSYSPQSRNVLF